MYKDEVREKLSQKREYNYYLLKEYLYLYIKLFFVFPNNKNLRNELRFFVYDYFLYSDLEKEILLHIKKEFGNDEDIVECEEILDKLEEIFFRQFNYNEYILGGYNDAIETQNPLRATIPNREFDIIDKEEKDKILTNLIKNKKN